MAARRVKLVRNFDKIKDHIKSKISKIKRKELALYISVLVGVLFVLGASTAIFDYTGLAAQEAKASNCFRVFINGENLGLVKSKADGEAAIKKATLQLTDELGYEPDVNPVVKYVEEYSPSINFTVSDSIVSEIQLVLRENMEGMKIKAYAIKIGEDFVVAVENEEDVKKVLENAKNTYVKNADNFGVTLDKSEYNSLVEVPKIVETKDVAQNKELAMTAGKAEAPAKKVAAVNTPKTVGVEFTEDIIVVEAYVASNKVLDVEEATKEITKANQEPVKYSVKEGDCPSTIATSNNMTLKKLIELNPRLASTELVNIGDELIVMVPKPELTITTKEEVAYKAKIAKTTKYIENEAKYEGTNKVIDGGADGEKLVTAIVTKINGKENSRTITEEVVVTEAKEKVIEKGTKKLPAKAATGSFVMPLARYTLSSGYGYRWGGFHYGVDLAASTGTVIRASDGGTVSFAGWSGGYGYLVILDHGNGVTTKYGHCSKITVSEGQKVAQYQEIARVGSTGQSTGPHCHFEIRFDGSPANPMNYVNR